MKLKKVIASALAGAMVFGTAASVSAATELTFWTLDTRMEAVTSIVEAFNAENEDIQVTASL